MKRPADAIRRINKLYAAAVKGNAQVTLIETWPLFANASGDAKPDEFPDLLHPNQAGYAKWSAALRPGLATLGLVETEPDRFTLEPGMVSLFNGQDLTGWGYRPTSEADIRAARDWQASDPGRPRGPVVTQAVSLRRPRLQQGRPIRGEARSARGDHAPGRTLDSAAFDHAGVPQGFRPQARVPGDAER